MTMDIKQSRMNGVKVTPGSPGSTSGGPLADLHLQHHHHHHPVAKLPGSRTSGKRSFDVAFLMMPDEKLARGKHPKRHLLPAPVPPQAPPSPTIDVESDSTQSEPRSEDLSHKSGFSPIRPTSTDVERHHFAPDVLQAAAAAAAATGLGRPPLASHTVHPAGSLGDLQTERLAYLFPGARFYEPFAGGGPFPRGGPGSLTASPDLADPPRSAFSKVAASLGVPDSPGPPPLSPDRHSCPSTSPPISLSPGSQHSSGFRYEYGPFLTPAGSPPARPDDPLHGKSPSSPPVLGKHPAHVTHGPVGLLYRPTGPVPLDPQDPSASATHPAYFPATGPHFSIGGPFGGASGGTPPVPEVDGLMRNPAAAAILSTLLPSAMSTFTLSAQNVCAKCNISFRMTSDLVYHMRSHHKSEREVHDQARRKREDKLKCPVCNESFRERHHLTRHMTAHQDKAGDLLETTTGKGSKRSVDQHPHGLLPGVPSGRLA
ncbi:PR domain zinc finger protein 8 [Anopheles bellator]|uniref:PR domain zinc finger protein 8 n=1 Tax=Anopheles bellator TaxID=139047 RepID=UPI00264865D6|nr:PR domain zinc finger protein 8 [Anopheles bellator]